MKFRGNIMQKRDRILLASAAAALLIALQFFVLGILDESAERFAAAKNEARAIKNAVSAAEASLKEYKSALKIDERVISKEFQTSTKAYSVLISILSERGFDAADISKADEKGDVVSFKVSGEAEYNRLIDLLASLRSGAYMMRISALYLEGQTDNYVKYTFVADALLASKERAK